MNNNPKDYLPIEGELEPVYSSQGYIIGYSWVQWCFKTKKGRAIYVTDPFHVKDKDKWLHQFTLH